MSTKRHSIHKIALPKETGIDAQFWPVVLALCLTGALGAGAVIATLQGPWMWGTLISLPFLVIAAIIALQRIPNGWLRRGLQFAVLCSVAAHLLFLIIAASTMIFHSSTEENVVQNAPKRSEKVILVQRRDAPQVWKKVQQRPPVETQKENERSQPENREQPTEQVMPASQQTQVANVTTERRVDSASSIPKLSESTSESKRSQAMETALSGGAMSPTPKFTEPAESSSRPAPSTNTVANENQRAAKNQPEKRSLANESLPQPTNQPSAEVSRRKAMGSESSEALAALATARLRESRTEISQSSVANTPTTIAQPKRSSKTPEANEQTTSIRLANSESRQNNSSEPQPSTSVPTPSSSNATRRQTTSSPAESLVENSANIPRPTRTESQLRYSPASKDVPAQPTAVAAASEPQPKMAETSLTRGVEGGALASESRNLAPGQQPTSGMAPQASTAARRETSQQNQTLMESLTSQQAANVRSSVAKSEQSASAQQVNTTMTAQIRGQREPALETTESSAATQNSSMASAPSQRIASDVGDVILDTGPTKNLNESDLVRAVAAGGGNENLGSFQPENVANESRESSGRSPAVINSQLAANASAPMAQGSESATRNDNPTESNATTDSNRAELAASEASSRELSPAIDDSEGGANAGESQIARRDGAENNDEEENELADFQKQDEPRNGNAESRLSRAAQVQSTVKLAEGRSVSDLGGNGRANAMPSPREGTANDRSLATIQTERVLDQPGIESNSQSSSGGAEVTRTQQNNEPGELLQSAVSRSPGRSSAQTQVSLQPTEVRSEIADVDARGRLRSATTPRSQVLSDRIAGSQRVELSEILGPSGLGEKPSPEAGTPSRPARRDSNVLQNETPNRFVREGRVETPSTRADAVAAKEAFMERTPISGAGGPTTEPSIELGLQFLSRFQKGDGRWILEEFDRDADLHSHQMRSDTAATGLALLAFQGAGYNHREFKYAASMSRAIDWLIEHQESDGCLYVPMDEKSNGTCQLYSHGIATLALTEAYGMTQDSRLQEPCQRALDYIAKTQDPKRGGWRYYADLGRRQSDTSVTGWMMMAMQSGRLAGFQTPKETWDRIGDWLDLARDSRVEGKFRYNPYAPDDREYQREVSPAITGVGVLMRLYSGWNRDDERVQVAADYLLEAMPNQDSSFERDTYHWYYATQVLRHIGGRRWEEWNLTLHPLLVESQIKTSEFAGSWDPYSPVPDRWGHVGGRLYVTAMNLLSLEVDYRLLPLYENTTK